MNATLSTNVPPAEAFAHVRTIIGIVLGLCVSRLLTGVARFIQHPGKQIIYPAHLAWVACALLLVTHFWWFEFNLRTIPVWTFERYMFVIFYAGLYFLLCTLLFPDTMGEYTGYRDYFLSRRKWFFGLLAVIFAVDVVDTLLKGMEHFNLYGPEYLIRAGVFIALSIVAACTENRRFHAAFAGLALVYQTVYILRHFAILA